MRAGNVMVHATNALLLWLLLRRLLSPTRTLLSASIAGLWAVMAVNSEPVLWISGRFDPLTVTVALGCMLANRLRSVWGTVFVVLLATCGLFIKETFMGWLPLLFLDDVWLLGRHPKQSIGKAIGLAVVIGLNLVVRQAVGIPSLSVVAETGLATLAQSHLFTFVTLVPRAFIPMALDPFHPYAPLPLGSNIVVGVLLAGLTGWFGWRGLRKESKPYQKISAFGWGWLVLGLFPASLTGPNLFMIGDRYAYLPCLGLIMVVFAEASAALERLRRLSTKARWFAGAVVAVAIVGQSWALIRRIPDWKDDRSLAEASLRAHPNNPYALYYLGYLAIGDNDLGRAEPLLVEAARGNPRCWRTANAICVLRLRQGRYREAQASCERSLAIHGDNPRAWVNLASVYVNEKRWLPALEASLEAVARKPFFPEARYLAAVSYANLGDLERAREQMDAGFAEEPKHPGLLDLQRQMDARQR
jgi:tetratricopeptide (TPR) repeat protein